ncbi:unnamed protein product, partial [Closterium sp. NIES-53]
MPPDYLARLLVQPHCRHDASVCRNDPRRRRHCQRHHRIFLVASLVALCASSPLPATVRADFIQPLPGLATTDDVALAESTSRNAHSAHSTPCLPSSPPPRKHHFSPPSPQSPTASPAEAALLSLGAALGGHAAFRWAGWVNASQGLSYEQSKPCVQFWEFLSCDSHGRVSSINIANPTLAVINASWANQKTPGGLKGSIPWDSLTALEHLQAVDLSGNSISGRPFTAAISKFTGLREIQLSRNALDAPLVGELSALFNLQKLDLSGNRIPGALPTGLSALTALEILSLTSNQLSDSFPAGLSALTALKKLDLASAGVRTPPPDSWAALSSLEMFSLQNNNLTAPFPAFLLQLPNISDITLFNNSLYGSLPTTLWNPTKLTFVEVSSNYLNGSLPQPPAGRSAQFSLSTNCLDQVPSQRPTDQCSRFYSSLPALIQS